MRAILIRLAAKAIFLPVFPLPIIHAAITLLVNPVSLEFVFYEVACILPAHVAGPDHFSSAVHALVSELSFVDAAVFPPVFAAA